MKTPNTIAGSGPESTVVTASSRLLLTARHHVVLSPGSSPIPTGNSLTAARESIPDHVCEAERDEFTEHLLAVAAEVDVVEELVFARHHVS